MTTSDRLRLGSRERSLPRHAAVCCAIVCSLAGCVSDALVYRLQPVEPDGRGDSGAAGSDGGAGAAGGDGGPDDVCTVPRDGARLTTSILDLIFSSVNPSCETDADCNTTVVFPRCDPMRSVCVPCPDLGGKIDDFTACFVQARERCCNTQASPLDCIYRDCVPGCSEP